MGKGLFVTGTDTEVGKTHFVCQHILRLKQEGIDVGVYKPVASGFARDDHRSDASRLYRALCKGTSKYRLEQINPQCFLAPLAPPLAAQAQGLSIDEELLVDGAKALLETCDILLVEGAGGLFSPLTWSMTNADLAVRLELDLIIVAENRLGCIHQILATVLAAQSVGLAIHAVVLNQTRKELDSAQTSNQTLLAPFLAKLDPRIQIWKESFVPASGVESTQS